MNSFSCRCLFPMTAVLFFAALTGCQTARQIGAPKPTATVRGVHFTGINPSAAAMAFDVDVINPYELPLPLTDVSYRILSDGKQLVSGKANLEGTIPPHQSKTITIPAEVKYADARAALVTVSPGEVVPYKAELTISAKAPETGPVTLNLLNIQGQLPIPASPSVTLTSVRWTSLSLDNAAATLNLHVTNRNQFALAMSRINCGLMLGDVPVATIATENTTNFSAGGSNDLSLPVTFSPKKLGTSVFNMLTGHGAQYQVRGEMNFNTAYGPMSLPFQQSGQTVLVH